ncbi:MAG TPA: glycoside hydrolase family 15 protein, partial [Flavisolibacter sp.]|nr:glycoside hydrolase family 15 protein [Flavisolibacter sp.]
EIIDFMPVDAEEKAGTIIRQVSTIRGNIRYKVCCAPHFNYANTRHKVQKKEESFLFTPDDDQQPTLLLSGSAPLKKQGSKVVASFEMAESHVSCFVLQSHEKHPHSKGWLTKFVTESYRDTIRFWQNWISQTNYNGHWDEVVRRSALTLKLLISQRFGSMVAAPTFSLPEAVGKGRNWDYRYTWIRDAAFTMHTFLQLGFLHEAERFLEWVKEQSTQKELQLMFAIDGRTDLTEVCLDYLDGYKGSRPVRVGNDAHKQVQMDIYGELLETIYIFVRHGGDITYDYWKIITRYVEYVMENWQKPDHSIWEVRGQKREFFFSRMMCWVAIDRAIKIGDRFSFPYDLLKC